MEYFTVSKKRFVYDYSGVIMLVLALILATVLNNKKSLKLKGFFRTSIFLPCVTSLVAYFLFK